MITKVDSIFLNYIKEALVEQMNEVVNDYNKYANEDKKLTLSRPVGETSLSYDCIEQVLTNVLGVIVKRSDFTWKRNALGGVFYYYSYEIGTQTLELNAGKSLQYIADEILATIYAELLAVEEQNRLLGAIANNGFSVANTFISPKCKDIPEFIASLGKSRYCDEEFVSILEQLGYSVKKGSFHGLYDDTELRYIDLSDLIGYGKLWLDVLYQPYTMYRDCKQRLRTEVLYILHGLQCGECWFFEEF